MCSSSGYYRNLLYHVGFGISTDSMICFPHVDLECRSWFLFLQKVKFGMPHL